jgi:hypothetical protein
MDNNHLLMDIRAAFGCVQFARSINAAPVLIYHYVKALLKKVNRLNNKALRSITFRMLNATRADYLRSVAA